MHFTSWFIADEEESAITLIIKSEKKEDKVIRLSKKKVLFVAVPVVAALTALAVFNLFALLAIILVAAFAVVATKGIFSLVQYCMDKYAEGKENLAESTSESPVDEAPKTPEVNIDINEATERLRRHFSGEDQEASPGDDIAPAGAQ